MLARGWGNAVSTTSKFFTEEDLLRMPDDGYRYELVRGELRKMPPAGFEHGRVTNRFGTLIGNWVDENGLGEVVAAETGFIIGRTPDGRLTIRAPDVGFVARGRVPAGADTSKFLELAPDLVVETLSPNDTAMEVEEKIADWLRAGVKVAVAVNPASRTVTVYRSAQITRLSEADPLDLSDVLEGFRCPVARVFGTAA